MAAAVLVAAQVAVALLLLVTAGLFLRSLQEAASVDIGFNTGAVDVLQIDTRIAGYSTDAEGLRVTDALMDRFRLVQGVTAVGASRMVPLQGGGLGLGGSSRRRLRRARRHRRDHDGLGRRVPRLFQRPADVDRAGPPVQRGGP